MKNHEKVTLLVSVTHIKSSLVLQFHCFDIVNLLQYINYSAFSFATSSPSCASFCLKQTASDNQGEFDEETIATVNRNFHVDGCLKSVSTTDKAARLPGQLRELLSRGGSRLTKWISNDRNVIATVPVTERASSAANLVLEDLPVERTLGVQWATETDDFNFRIMDGEKASTRREILSVVSSMYDPLGFNFRIMDGGKAPTRRGILSVVSSMYDPLGFVARPSFCQPRFCCRAYVSRSMAGTKIFLMQVHCMVRMAEGACMSENNISSQVFQATRIRCSRQRSVTSFLRCL